jgi:hypothetical protein
MKRMIWGLLLGNFIAYASEVPENIAHALIKAKQYYTKEIGSNGTCLLEASVAQSLEKSIKAIDPTCDIKKLFPNADLIVECFGLEKERALYRILWTAKQGGEMRHRMPICTLVALNSSKENLDQKYLAGIIITMLKAKFKHTTPLSKISSTGTHHEASKDILKKITFDKDGNLFYKNKLVTCDDEYGTRISAVMRWEKIKEGKIACHKDDFQSSPQHDIVTNILYLCSADSGYTLDTYDVYQRMRIEKRHSKGGSCKQQ